MRKLVVDTLSSDLVDAYLHEIAKGYGVPWGSSSPETVVEPDKVLASSFPVYLTEHYLQAKQPEEPAKDSPEEQPPGYDTGGEISPKAQASKVNEEDDFDTLAKRFAALKKR
jgi:vacuolar protein sorting-associated protein IST1